MVGLKTILCIDVKQRVPFRASRVLEPGYVVFRVPDAGMAGKVRDLFKIDFVLGSEDDRALPVEILKAITSTPD
jgi:hypothetical protein